MEGHSGVSLRPPGPWHTPQYSASERAAPFSGSPGVAGSLPEPADAGAEPDSLAAAIEPADDPVPASTARRTPVITTKCARRPPAGAILRCAAAGGEASISAMLTSDSSRTSTLPRRNPSVPPSGRAAQSTPPVSGVAIHARSDQGSSMSSRVKQPQRRVRGKACADASGTEARRPWRMPPDAPPSCHLCLDQLHQLSGRPHHRGHFATTKRIEITLHGRR